MNIRHLQVYNIVCKTESMKETAHCLYISEPAVSRYIHELEEELGVKLLRRKKPLVLTEEGKELYRRSKIVEEQFNDLQAVFRPQQTETCLRIGVVSSVAEPLLTKLMPVFPEIFNISQQTVRLFVYDANKLSGMLINNQLDYVISDIAPSGDNYSAFKLYTDTMSIVCAVEAEYPTEMSLTDISKLPLLLRNKESGNRIAVDAAFNQNGLLPNVFMESESNYVLLRMAHRNFGLTILSSSFILRELEENYIREIKISDFGFSRSFYLICPKYRNGERVAELLKQSIENIVSENLNSLIMNNEKGFNR